jgi:hypothetical protein
MFYKQKRETVKLSLFILLISLIIIKNNWFGYEDI